MGKTVAICQFGGEIVTNRDGSVSYNGGEAHAIQVVPSMKLEELKSEIAEMCNCDGSTLTLKYLLPNNRRTPISLSNDKDMQRMIDFHEGSATIDVFVLGGEVTESSKQKGESTAKKTVKNINNRASTNASRSTPGRPSTRSATRAAAAETTAINDEKAVTIAATEPSTPISGIVSTVDTNRTPSRTRIRTTSPEPITPLATAFGSISNDKHSALLGSVDDLIAAVGQEFASTNHFREALCRYAIAKRFICVYIKNENSRVTAKCKAEGCPWRVHASKLSALQKFKIKKLNNVHTCGCGVGKDGHPQASQRWVASVIKEKLREMPNYKPRDIASDIFQEYGVNLKYHLVRRGKEMALEQLQESRAEAYNQLPWFCEKIRETNPGSLVTLTTTDDSRFERLFVSFNALQDGFENGCRPLILLDGISLQDKFRGALLTAVSVDAEEGIFPLAFAVVHSESYDNWHWFLGELKSAVSTNRTITFISDRHNGLKDAVPQVFEDSYHAYSLYHLIEDFKQVLKGPTQEVKDAMIDEFRRAAYACRPANFNACIDNIRNVSHDIATWVMSTRPEHWSNAFFRGSRYDHVSSNVAELFYGWIAEERELSIIQVVDMIRCKVMEMMYTRREVSSSWSTILTPSKEQRLQVEIFNSHSLNVLFSTGSMYEVRDGTVNIVNLETWDCTCRRWPISGLPCIHAVAVFDRAGRNMYDYCSRYFTVECYRLTYSESINPVPQGKPEGEDSAVQMVVRPPLIRRPHRPPGRPRKRRKELLDPSKKLRLLHCSKCGVAGHNKATCKEAEQ